MNRKYFFIFAACALIAGGFIYKFFFETIPDRPSPEPVGQKVVPEGVRLPDRADIYLYFADGDNSYLIGEKRTIPFSRDPVEFGKNIIRALAKGPKENLMHTIPEGASLKSFYVGKDKIAFLDMSAALKENHPGGSKAELVTIYSIVNSLVLNIPEIDAVKILIGGREEMTLAGHVDMRRPFRADMLLVR